MRILPLTDQQEKQTNKQLLDSFSKKAEISKVHPRWRVIQERGPSLVSKRDVHKTVSATATFGFGHEQGLLPHLVHESSTEFFYRAITAKMDFDD